MQSITRFLFLFTLLFFQACHMECGECFTPPASFAFELVDKESGENVFANGTYISADLEIINLADSSAVEYSFIAENNFNIIVINSIGWKTEIVNCSFNLSAKHICNFHVDAERLNDDCCSYTVYNEMEIADAEYAWDNSRGIYQILVE